MGLLDFFRTRGIEWDDTIDLGIEDITDKIHLKRLAIQTCVNMIAKSISQTEFKAIGDIEASDELLYRLNVRPNINQSSAAFWEKVVSKLIYDNEVLIVRSDTDDLLIADSFEQVHYAMVDNTFKSVVVGDFEFQRIFSQRDVIFWQLNNDHLMKSIDGLYADYGELFGRLMEFQKRKGQIRGIFNTEGINDKGEDARRKIESYVNKVFQNFQKNSVSIIPLQKGMSYTEIGANQPVSSVDEINRLTDGFLNQIAKALGIPIALLVGEMSDVEKQTKNYMTFCVRPLLKKITDELNGKFLYKKEYLEGARIKAVAVSYHSIFDLATSADKLISSGALTINEVREEMGLHPSTDEIANTHFITKNYTKLADSEDTLEGGDNK